MDVAELNLKLSNALFEFTNFLDGITRLFLIISFHD